MEQIHFVTHFQDLSSRFMDLWLPQVDFLETKPYAVLLPCGLAIDNLKIACAQREIALDNLSFFSPDDLRSFLSKFLDSCSHGHKNYEVVSPKTLKFWARNILKSREKRRNLKLQALQGDIEKFLQTFALWKQASLSQKTSLFDDDFSFLANILDRFLFHHNWVLSAEEAYSFSESKEKIFQNAFIGGFFQQNWDDLPLIRILTQLSSHTTFVNFLGEDSRWDALWKNISSQLFRDNASLSLKFASAPSISTRGKITSSDAYSTLPSEHFTAETLDQEITQVCQKLQSIMASPLEGCVAIILPRESSLEAILLSKQLQQMGISFTSSLALPPSIRTYPVVNSWCQWQKSDQIHDYFAFVQSLFSSDLIDASIKKSLQEEITLAITELGVWHSGMLLDWLLEKTKNDDLKSFLKTWYLWPEKAELQLFQSYLLQNLDKNLWGTFPHEIQTPLVKELQLLQVWDKRCFRSFFIEFFETSFQELISKTTNYSFPSAKICLMTYEEVRYGTWQYVFFFRSAEKSIPHRPWSGNPWLKDANWSAYWKSLLDNSSTWSLKKHATIPLRPQEKDHFFTLNAKKFRQKFFQKNGYFFSVFEKHDADSCHSLSDTSPFEHSPQKNTTSVRYGDENSTQAVSQSIPSNSSSQSFSNLKEIYHQRRDPQRSFGAWDYSLEAPLWKYFSFPCKTWESILQNPEESWYRHILKQESETFLGEQKWPKMALGLWVHDFLNFPEASKKMQNLPDLSEGYEHIRSRAKRFRKNVEIFFSKHGMRLHTIWEVAWNEALQSACQLFRRIVFYGKSCEFQSEFTLPDEAYLLFPSGTSLALKGRVDLCLQQGTQSYIIDYKTGGDRPLTGHQWYRIDSLGKALVSAQGLQLILYGIALQNKGWNDIRLMILKPDTPMGEGIEKEQLCLSALKEDPNFIEFLRIFENIINKGIFGLRPVSHFFQKHFRKPLAVLPIENHILRERCLKTFTCVWE
jgi:hypothetical protein